MNRTLVGGLIGAAVAVVSFIAIRELTKDFQDAAIRFNDGGMRAALIWLILFGAFIGAVSVAGRVDPIIPGVPAVALFLIYLPVLIGLSVPAWYPDWLKRDILIGASPMPYVVIGVLASAAGWGFVRQPSPEPESVTPDHSPIG